MNSVTALVTAEIVSAAALLIAFAGILDRRKAVKSTRPLFACLIVHFVWLLSDAAAYTTSGHGLPDFLLYAVNYVSFTGGSVSFFFFARYCHVFIAERTKVSKWAFFIPCGLVGTEFLYITYLVLAGRLFAFSGGNCTMLNGLPWFISVTNIIVVASLPAVCFSRVKDVGVRASVILGLYGAAPIISIFGILNGLAYDYTPAMCTIALLLICFMLQNDFAFEKEREYQKVLAEKNEELACANAEQAARLEEIRALNAQLQDNQTQLEEAAAEQEAQIEEITALNTQLEESQAQAEEANAAKTTFLFNMSHDIRTPMNAVIGFTELLRKHKDDPEKLDDYIGKIESSSRFLLSLINSVLEVARIESGKTELDEEPVHAGAVTEEMRSMFEPQMQKKGITFTVKADVQADCILCDRAKIHEIYLNILSNAYKYTPAGGTVSVQTTQLPSKDPGIVPVRLVISDTGIGMTKEYLPHIFEEFSRERTSTESRQEGTGLGMPIVKKLVDLMGGTIAVESEIGKGSTFTVTIPFKAADACPVKTAETAAESFDFSGKRLLLAEDNDLNAEIAMEILSEAGLQVERAEDGVVCVDMLSKAEACYYDAILMDIQMPNLNGYEATGRIRALSDPAKANIPIFAMTANAFEEDRRNALTSGMNGHLAKPIDVSELMKTLAEVLK